MHVIRPSKVQDSDKLIKLVSEGGFGMFTLPHDRVDMESKIRTSIDAFSADVSAPKDERYFFVLENTLEGTIDGCCAIYSKSGVDEPDEYFGVETILNENLLPNQPESLQILRVKSYRNGPSLLCSIFLSKRVRQGGLGRLLSLSRLLFIASHPHRFTRELIASIRGIIHDDGTSPFWEGLCRHFLDVDYFKLMKMMESDSAFIDRILPKFPVYVCLLPDEAQNIIGKVHVRSQRALDMLLEQGFRLTDEIDLFDAGPKISAHIDELDVVKNRLKGKITKILDTQLDPNKQWLISNDNIEFRACQAPLEISKTGIAIEASTAAVLNVEIGSEISYADPGGKFSPRGKNT